MASRRRLFVDSTLFLALSLSLGVLTMSVPSHAQTLCATSGICPGDNSVYSTSGSINAHSYIDASQMGGTDICAQINAALLNVASHNIGNGTNFTYGGNGVVDARNIGPGTTQSCTSGNPWPSSNIGTGYWPPAATVLLPAGTIQVSQTWTLPPGTHLVGQGPQATIIQATSSLGSVLQMGTWTGLNSTSYCQNEDCNGIVIEHLGIDENKEGVIGILNEWSQELNYVSDVYITNVDSSGTGLEIIGNNDSGNGNAVNSGPYSGIYVIGATTTGTCVNIVGTYGTRGVHDLHCIGGSTKGTAAILLDGSNNTIEDVNISGYTEGVLIGSQLPANAQNNILLNVSGTSVTNVVHICGTNASTNCGTSANPTDITLMGINSGSGTTNTVEDMVTKTTLSHTTDSNVSLYILGEPVPPNTNYSNLGYSRFTTSPSVPAWFSGPAIPSSTSCSVNGSIYSVTSGTTAPTLYGCIGGTWTGLTTH